MFGNGALLDFLYGIKKEILKFDAKGAKRAAIATSVVVLKCKKWMNSL